MHCRLEFLFRTFLIFNFSGKNFFKSYKGRANITKSLNKNNKNEKFESAHKIGLKYLTFITSSRILSV